MLSRRVSLGDAAAGSLCLSPSKQAEEDVMNEGSEAGESELKHRRDSREAGLKLRFDELELSWKRSEEEKLDNLDQQKNTLDLLLSLVHKQN